MTTEVPKTDSLPAASDAALKDDVYEHVFNSVPEDKRKSLISLTIVLAGYPIALSNFVIGGAVGVGLSFTNAILALVIGNAILISVVVLTGLMAYKTGLSTAFLSRRAFGGAGSHIFSILLAISAVTWVALNGDIFARMIIATFTSWPLGIPLTAIIVIVMWMQSAIRGYKGLEIVSFLGVPAALFMALYGCYAVFQSTNGFAGLSTYMPSKPITFSAATAAIVGGWVFGATITPDVCRFAKSKRDVVIAGLGAFVLGCFGLQLIGALVAITTGTGDFVKAMAALDLLVVAFIAAIFCLWTTQDNNIYGASLALQNVIRDTRLAGKVSHKKIAVGIALAAAIFAAGGIYSKILPVIKFLSILIPPVPGIIMAEEFVIKDPKPNLSVHWNAMIAWLLGGVASYFSLTMDFFVPPIVGIISSGILYIALTKLASK